MQNVTSKLRVPTDYPPLEPLCNFDLLFQLTQSEIGSICDQLESTYVTFRNTKSNIDEWLETIACWPSFKYGYAKVEGEIISNFNRKLVLAVLGDDEDRALWRRVDALIRSILEQLLRLKYRCQFDTIKSKITKTAFGCPLIEFLSLGYKAALRFRHSLKVLEEVRMTKPCADTWLLNTYVSVDACHADSKTSPRQYKTKFINRHSSGEQTMPKDPEIASHVQCRPPSCSLRKEHCLPSTSHSVSRNPAPVRCTLNAFETFLLPSRCTQ